MLWNETRRYHVTNVYIHQIQIYCIQYVYVAYVLSCSRWKVQNFLSCLSIWKLKTFLSYCDISSLNILLQRKKHQVLMTNTIDQKWAERGLSNQQIFINPIVFLHYIVFCYNDFKHFANKSTTSGKLCSVANLNFLWTFFSLPYLVIFCLFIDFKPFLKGTHQC